MCVSVHPGYLAITGEANAMLCMYGYMVPTLSSLRHACKPPPGDLTLRRLLFALTQNLRIACLLGILALCVCVVSVCMCVTLQHRFD